MEKTNFNIIGQHGQGAGFALYGSKSFIFKDCLQFAEQLGTVKMICGKKIKINTVAMTELESETGSAG